MKVETDANRRFLRLINKEIDELWMYQINIT